VRLEAAHMRFITLLLRAVKFLIRLWQNIFVYGNIYLMSLILLHPIHSWQHGVGAVPKFKSGEVIKKIGRGCTK